MRGVVFTVRDVVGVAMVAADVGMAVSFIVARTDVVDVGVPGLTVSFRSTRLVVAVADMLASVVSPGSVSTTYC